MFPDVLACFSVGPAALCKQIEDWCQLLFDLFTLKSKKTTTTMTPSGYLSFNDQPLFFRRKLFIFARPLNIQPLLSPSPTPAVSPWTAPGCGHSPCWPRGTAPSPAPEAPSAAHRDTGEAALTTGWLCDWWQEQRVRVDKRENDRLLYTSKYKKYPPYIVINTTQFFTQEYVNTWLYTIVSRSFWRSCILHSNWNKS